MFIFNTFFTIIINKY